MAELSGLLLVVVILALLFDFSNGWHDSANAIATVVSTRVVSPSTAVLVAGILNVAGAFMSTAVAKMVGTGIVDPQSVTQTVVASALAGAIVWNFMTLLLGLPTSSSHALIGGLVGAALTHGGMAAVKFSGLRSVLEAMILSPFFGFAIGLVLMVVLSWLFFRVPRALALRLFPGCNSSPRVLWRSVTGRTMRRKPWESSLWPSFRPAYFPLRKCRPG